MAPSQRVRPSPYDKFTDASATAVASGFSAAMALGPQPKLNQDKEEGTDWLRNLQKQAGFINQGRFPPQESASGAVHGLGGEDDDLTDDDDGESEDGSATGGKRKGRKSKTKSKGSKANNDDSTAAQRKAQNRLAQREFRQRKQQYIRALEARVELLSSDHDTQVDRLRYALRGLLAENNQLRSLLGCMSAFIGTEMLGGPMQKAGMSRKELEKLILGSSEKTMTEAWENWPGARECEALNQIRLESNLPKEGLPESHRYGEYASNSGAPASISTKAHLGSDLPGAKRKLSADDDYNNGKNDKRKQQKAEGNSESNFTHDTASESQMQPLNSSFAGMSQTIPPDQASSYDTYYSRGDAPQYNARGSANLPNVSADVSAEAMYNGLSMFAPSTPSGDSNAILASLFGPTSMGNIFEQSPMSSLPQFATGTQFADSATDSSGVRMKTIANAEEPEEIRRINAFADKLSSGSSPVDPSQLQPAVKGITELIHQMATFRRQPSHQLPSLLIPSDIQQTRPHDPLIDALPFSGLRQRLIVLQDGLAMDDVLFSFLQHARLHSGDATNAANWELAADFFAANRELLDRDTIAITNSWRSTRDEKPLSFGDQSTRQ